MFEKKQKLWSYYHTYFWSNFEASFAKEIPNQIKFQLEKIYCGFNQRIKGK